MLDRIDLFRMASAMASHAGTGQAVVAQNIANADTPGYKARDVVGFAELVGKGGDAFIGRATRGGHLHGSTGNAAAHPAVIERESARSNPNDNQVSLEEEMLKAVEVKR